MNELDSKISTTVWGYIKAENISQEALGKRIGISQSSLSRSLAGKKPWLVRDIEALAAVGVDFSNLFTGEVEDV